MYRMETEPAALHYVASSGGGACRSGEKRPVFGFRFSFWAVERGLVSLRKLRDYCKNLKQSADTYLDGKSRKESAENRFIAKEINQLNNVAPIPVSSSGAEFFLDKKSALAYHAAKFWGRFMRTPIFRLRGSAKSINWPTCIDARIALPFVIWVGLATGREQKQLGNRRTSTANRSLKDEESSLQLSVG